ncbi:uncharacterized protein LOC124166715 [Ischnura elegans]|uniref:uncharacterized protein LOC124166715 n=1 Tax=Ischnura elegans TaxID=197161 RepID=UPI001ED87B0D|nr:uncharacterized protein LOC124166715 [Ischnura elegans]
MADKRTESRSNNPLLSKRSKGDSVDPVTTFLASPFATENTPRVTTAFSVFDSGNRKRVEVEDIPIVVRVLGLYPTDREMKDIVAQTEDPDFENYIKFDKFLPVILKMMEEKKYPPDSPEVLMQAFEYFDPKKKGYLEEDFFKHILTISAEDEEGINKIEQDLENVHKSMELKISISDEKFPETPPPEEEVVEEKSKKKVVIMEEEEEAEEEEEEPVTVEPLSSDELDELLQVALDKETNTIKYGELVLKFLSCQYYKEPKL